MIVKGKIDENGVVKVIDPVLHGKEICLSLSDHENEHPEIKTNWQEMKKIFKKIDAMDFPQRTHKEILNDLRDLRES